MNANSKVKFVNGKKNWQSIILFHETLRPLRAQSERNYHFLTAHPEREAVEGQIET
jgi:hypothetical protein